MWRCVFVLWWDKEGVFVSTSDWLEDCWIPCKSTTITNYNKTATSSIYQCGSSTTTCLPPIHSHMSSSHTFTHVFLPHIQYTQRLCLHNYPRYPSKPLTYPLKPLETQAMAKDTKLNKMLLPVSKLRKLLLSYTHGTAHRFRAPHKHNRFKSH